MHFETVEAQFISKAKAYLSSYVCNKAENAWIFSVLFSFAYKDIPFSNSLGFFLNLGLSLLMPKALCYLPEALVITVEFLV